MAGIIISGVVFGFVALIMFGIGISQLKSKDPVGFYTGEKPPEKERLSDVNAWNKKHGMLSCHYFDVAKRGSCFRVRNSAYFKEFVNGAVDISVIILPLL